jgi:hypothetical protein
MSLPGFTAELALEGGHGRYCSSPNRQSRPTIDAATIDAATTVCGPCIRHGQYGYKVCYRVVNGARTLPFILECG